MADVADARRRQALDVHQRCLQMLVAKDMDGWVDLFADGAIFELPFAPGGYPERLEGRDAIRDYIEDYPKYIDLHDFSDVTVHATLDPEMIVVEMCSEGRVVATDRPYRIRYIGVITVRDGKIVRYRDYWNPLAVIEAMGGEQALREAFVDEEV